jgi:hypothetical protein
MLSLRVSLDDAGRAASPAVRVRKGTIEDDDGHANSVRKRMAWHGGMANATLDSLLPRQKERAQPGNAARQA